MAQALTPASPAELLMAKFLFYPAFGRGLAATLAAVYKPAVLSSLLHRKSFAVEQEAPRHPPA